MEFSKNDKWLIAVTRDRQILLFERKSADSFEFNLFKRVKEGHSRTIWAVAWSHDDCFIATASRENKKSVKIWMGVSDSSPREDTLEQHSLLPAETVPSSTSIQFFPDKVNGTHSLIVGLEAGTMSIWTLKEKEWNMIYKFADFMTHGLAVRKIKFAGMQTQKDEKEGKNRYTVATCGDDHTVRVF